MRRVAQATRAFPHFFGFFFWTDKQAGDWHEMNPAIRVLYKEVLRQARQFDSHPVLKALASPARRPPEFSSLLGPAFANYVPSQSKSYTKAVREYFRKPIGPNEVRARSPTQRLSSVLRSPCNTPELQSFTDRLNLALRAMRYLTSQKSDLMTAGVRVIFLWRGIDFQVTNLHCVLCRRLLPFSRCHLLRRHLIEHQRIQNTY
jgi:hypothetical protein